MDEPATVLAYVRPVEGADPPLDATIQRTAVRACARGEGFGTPEIYEETAAAGRLGFLHLVNDLATRRAERRPPPAVIVPTLAVLGDTALERARRLITLEALDARVVLADGFAPEEALQRAWEGRPDTERRRERTREAMRARALRGFVLGRPPYGYVVEERTLQPHPRESHVVKRIFREYVDEGEGLRRIAAGLNRDGLRSRLGRPWTPGAVRTVLRNPAYTGLYRRLGVVVPAAHPALIDRATFHAAQRRMAERRTSRSKQERHVYPLSGILRCGRCGSPMIGERRRTAAGIAVVYRCEGATARGTCRAPSHRADALEGAILDELRRADEHYPVSAQRAPGERDEGHRQRLERQLAAAVERWAAGEWRYGELVQRAAGCATELVDLERSGYVDEDEAPDPTAARTRLVEEWDALEPEARAVLLRAAVAEVTVDGDDVRIALKR